jgi:hypothetical protein
MTLFREVKKHASKIFLLTVMILSVLLQGCECTNDACLYSPGTNALWSDTNEKLALVITDFGDDTSTKDNTASIFIMNADGSNIENIYSLKNNQSLYYYSSAKNYMLLQEFQPDRYGTKNYTRLNLDNLNEEILGTRDKTCFDRHIIPSLDSSILAVVEITGEENGFIGGSDSYDSETLYSIYYNSNESNTGCNNLIMTVDFIDSFSGDYIAGFINNNSNLRYFVYPENTMSVTLSSYWSNDGFIFKNSYFHDDYYLLKQDGTSSVYSFPQDCYPLAVSSAYLSQRNVVAKSYVILDNGVHNKDSKFELTDLSNASQEDYPSYSYPSARQDICVL